MMPTTIRFDIYIKLRKHMVRMSGLSEKTTVLARLTVLARK